jgi:hypothetical protein
MVQVRFLSHLPRKPRIYLSCGHMVCSLFFVLLTTVDPNGSNIDSPVSDAQQVYQFRSGRYGKRCATRTPCG